MPPPPEQLSPRSQRTAHSLELTVVLAAKEGRHQQTLEPGTVRGRVKGGPALGQPAVQTAPHSLQPARAVSLQGHGALAQPVRQPVTVEAETCSCWSTCPHGSHDKAPRSSLRAPCAPPCPGASSTVVGLRANTPASHGGEPQTEGLWPARRALPPQNEPQKHIRRSVRTAPGTAVPATGRGGDTRLLEGPQANRGTSLPHALLTPSSIGSPRSRLYP